MTHSAGLLQLACGLVALSMLGGLVSGLATPSPTATHASAAVFLYAGVGEASSPGEPTVFPRTCIKRVVDLTRKYPELDIVAVIDRECFSPHQPRTTSNRVAARPACARAARWQAAPPRPVSGCLVV